MGTGGHLGIWLETPPRELQEEPPVPFRSGARHGVPPPPPSLASGTPRRPPQRSSPGTEGRVSRAPLCPSHSPAWLWPCAPALPSPPGPGVSSPRRSLCPWFPSLVAPLRCPPAPFGSTPVSPRSLTGRSDRAQRGRSRRAAAMSAGSRDRAHPHT